MLLVWKTECSSKAALHNIRSADAFNLAREAETFVYLTCFFHENILYMCKTYNIWPLNIKTIFLVHHGIWVVHPWSKVLKEEKSQCCSITSHVLDIEVIVFWKVCIQICLRMSYVKYYAILTHGTNKLQAALVIRRIFIPCFTYYLSKKIFQIHCIYLA